MRNLKGFTIMELMVVVVMVGIIAGFAIPSFTRSIAKGHERDMVNNLISLHSSNLIFNAKNNTYWDTAGATINTLATINATLNINIIASDGTIYDYTSANGSAFTARATWGGFRVDITNAPVSATNPSCGAGPCPSL